MGKAETAREAGGNRTPEQASGFTLRKTRLKRGLSQQALADKGGYHRTYIGLLEGGQKSPSLRTLFNIAVTPQVQPSRILESVERLLNRTERKRAGSADRRFCGPRLFRSYYRHRAVFYRGVETPVSSSFRSILLYRRAPAQAAREIHRP